MSGKLAYREEPREEIIGGKVVMLSSPVLNHIFVTNNLYSIFNDHLRGKACTPIGDGATLYLEPGEEYKPDVMVVCDPEKLRKKGVYGAPDLVVEVLSPSTARYDKGHKRERYEAAGVREYWIVDIQSRTVDQYVLEEGKFVLRDVYTQLLPEDLEDMTQEELSSLVTQFPCALVPQLTVRLEDIFYRVMSR